MLRWNLTNLVTVGLMGAVMYTAVVALLSTFTTTSE
jgi:hypothetical protein